jgi:hypothetical protein
MLPTTVVTYVIRGCLGSFPGPSLPAIRHVSVKECKAEEDSEAGVIPRIELKISLNNAKQCRSNPVRKSKHLPLHA